VTTATPHNPLPEFWVPAYFKLGVDADSPSLTQADDLTGCLGIRKTVTP